MIQISNFSSPLFGKITILDKKEKIEFYDTYIDSIFLSIFQGLKGLKENSMVS